MANKSLTTRQKMVFRGKPNAPLPVPGQTQTARANRKKPIIPSAGQRTAKPPR